MLLEFSCYAYSGLEAMASADGLLDVLARCRFRCGHPEGLPAFGLPHPATLELAKIRLLF
jgi:hypothetical protein